MRTAEKIRETKETKIELKLNLDGSGNYNIITSGEVFLFGESNELAINIKYNSTVSHSLIIRFFKDDTNNQQIKNEIINDNLVINCYNFDDASTGLLKPEHIANIDGKKVYLMFWSNLEGSKKPKTRSVRYTFFKEK